MTLIAITLPWPPRELSPNARHSHWSSLARAKRRFRSACAITARSQGAARIESNRLAVALVFVPPCRRHRDVDNCVAAMKSGLDGLADVLGVDDSRWHWSRPPVLAQDEIGGFVRVDVSAWPS